MKNAIKTLSIEKGYIEDKLALLKKIDYYERLTDIVVKSDIRSLKRRLKEYNNAIEILKKNK